MEFCRFWVVVLFLARSSRQEHELSSADKWLSWQSPRAWSWTCLKLCLHSNFPCLKTNYISDRFFHFMAYTNKLRYHLSVLLSTFIILLNFFLFVVTATVMLHSVAKGIGFLSFWTYKSDGRFEQFLGRIWWGFGLRTLRLLFLAFLSVLRGSHWYHKAGPLHAPSTFFKIHQF